MASEWANERAAEILGRNVPAQMTPLLLNIADALDAAKAAGRGEMREEAAQLADDRATGCRNIAATILAEWMGPDIGNEDRIANARDRREHLERIPLYEGLARVIRALPDNPDSSAQP